MEMYRKESSSEVMTNFRKEVTPKRYLISTLYGEIHRGNNTTSNEEDLII